MRIGIDVRWLHNCLDNRYGVQILGGIGTYILQLVRHLLLLHQENEYILFGIRGRSPQVLYDHLPKTVDRVRFEFLPCTFHSKHFDRWLGVVLRIVQAENILAPALTRFDLQVMHWPSQLEFAAGVDRSASVVTVHDITRYRFAEGLERPLTRLAWSLHLRRLQRMSHIITDSQNTRRDVVTLFGVDPIATTSVYLGVDQRTAGSMSPGVGTEDLPCDTPYLLYIGGLQPTKNVGRLLEAFRLIVTNRNMHIQLCMVMAEPSLLGRPVSQLASRLEQMGLSHNVLVLAYQEPDQLSLLLRNATMLVHPSLYEGFGLPVLEAMSVGTPVVVSRRGSLPEVAGDCGEYVEACDPQSIADGILRLMLDSGRRQALGQAAILRARQFTWQRTAARTMAVYKRVAGGGS